MKSNHTNQYRDAAGDSNSATKIELHSAEKVAETLGVKLDTLYRYARGGKIPGLKVGKAWRFLDVDVREFLQKQWYSVKATEPKTAILPHVPNLTAKGPAHHADATHGGGEVSYIGVENASNLLAESLLSRGVCPGDLVLILLSNSLESVVACFAAWKAGAVLVLENPSLNDAALRDLIQRRAPQALIIDPEVAGRLEAQHCALDNVRVVYIKEKSFNLSHLGAARVESLDAVLDSNSAAKVLRIHRPSPDQYPSRVPAM